MAIVVYNKLVRDKIPQMIGQSGRICVCETLPEARYLHALADKLREETEEYLESGALEELADIEEVIRAILDCRGVSVEELERVRLEKREARGGFGGRILLKEISAE